LPREAIRDGADEQQQGNVVKAERELRLFLVDFEEARVKAEKVSRDPGQRGQGQVPSKEPENQDLAFALDHAHPWGGCLTVRFTTPKRQRGSLAGASGLIFQARDRPQRTWQSGRLLARPLRKCQYGARSFCRLPAYN